MRRRHVRLMELEYGARYPSLAGKIAAVVSIAGCALFVTLILPG